MVPWERLIELIEGSEPRDVVVVGDYMLDSYLYGDAERISPEAPVPVVRVVGETAAVGGAGSVAANIAALGDRAWCIGIVGDDETGRTVRRLLSELGADVSGLLAVPSRPTTRKTRLVGLAQHRHRQQMMRIDAENTDPIGPDVVARLLAQLESRLGHCGVICLQDYGKGVVTPELASRAIAAAKRAGAAVLVDPARSTDYSRYAGATLVTPNRSETELVSGLKLPSVAAVTASADRIRAACRTEHVCVTLDTEGIALLTADGRVEHVPTRSRDVYDVTGAGDAVLAALAVASARGATLLEAAAIANVAGGIEVEKFGCVPVTRDEMLGELLRLSHEQLGKRRDLARLLPELERRRRRGERIVFTNGCFDLLHPGHIAYFAECRRLGDVLVVGLNSDASVRGQGKGDDRPIMNEDDRARMLSALADIDYVVRFDEPTPLRLIEAIRPDVLAKGEDWAERGVVGREVVERSGGRVVLIRLLEGYSTTALLERIRGRRGPG